MTPYSPLAQVAYDMYAKTRGRGGDQNDGPAWDAVAAAVIEAYKESIKPWFHVDYSKRPEAVILRRMTDDEVRERREKFAIALRSVHNSVMTARRLRPIGGLRLDHVPELVANDDAAWLAVAERAETEFAPDTEDGPLTPTPCESSES